MPYWSSPYLSQLTQRNNGFGENLWCILSVPRKPKYYSTLSQSIWDHNVGESAITRGEANQHSLFVIQHVLIVFCLHGKEIMFNKFNDYFRWTSWVNTLIYSHKRQTVLNKHNMYDSYDRSSNKNHPISCKVSKVLESAFFQV